MKKKLTCHCGEFVAEVIIPDTGIKKIMRCNCTLCKRKGYVIGVLGENDFKIIKGENLLKLYQYYTKAAKHYFCSNCGIQTHNLRRRDPNTYGINVACINDISTKELFDFKVRINDGRNHIMDR